MTRMNDFNDYLNFIPMDNISRRKFIKKSTLLAAGAIVIPTIIPAFARGKNGHFAPSF